MAFFKITYVFRTASAGWSEIFYDESDSFEDFVGPRAPEINAVLAPRGGGVTLLASKVTEEGGLRRSKIFPINRLVSATGAPNSNVKDVSEVTAKVRLNFADGGGRILNVRGVPDFGVKPESDRESIPSADLTANLRSYINWIKKEGNPYLGKRLKPITEQGFEWQDVVSFKADPTNENWTLVTPSTLAAPLPVGTQVYFRGIDRLAIPWIRGIYRTVGPTTVDNFSIPTFYRYPSATFFTKNVQFRIAEYDYPAITEGNFLRLGTRQTAGPFGERRGARSALRTR